MTLQSFLWSKRLQEQGTEVQARAAADAGIAAMDAPLEAVLDGVFSFRQGATHGRHVKTLHFAPLQICA